MTDQGDSLSDNQSDSFIDEFGTKWDKHNKLTQYAKDKGINAKCYSVEYSKIKSMILLTKNEIMERTYSEKEMMMKIDIRACNEK